LRASTWGLIGCAALSALALAACGSSGGVSTSGNGDLFTSAGFQKAYDAVTDKAGENAQILQVQVSEGGAEFTLKNGDQASGFIYTGGDLHDQKVEIVGPFSIEGQDFPISEVDPAAVDKIVSGVQAQSENNDAKVTVLKLDKQNAEGKVQWTVIAEGGGRTGIPYTAEPDGSDVSSALGGSAPAGATVTAPNGKTPSEISSCIQRAGTDVAKIQACTQ
jgi:hypothetical protein